MVIFRSIKSCFSVVRVRAIIINVRSMSSAGAAIKFQSGLTASDPEKEPVLFLGQASHLSGLSWNDVKCKLEPHVNETMWKRSVSVAVASPGESASIWCGGAMVTSLSPRCSRHCAPARPHSVASIVKAAVPKLHPQSIVLVCRKRDLLASCVAIGRSFPLYSARSGPGPLAISNSVANSTANQPTSVNVEILLVQDHKEGECIDETPVSDPEYLLTSTLSDEDLKTIQAITDGARLAAKIADMPTNQMQVSQFLEEARSVAASLDIQPPLIIRGEELKAKGLGGLYGVGAASTDPPALCVLTYKGGPTTVAWVGKGIVYDTGGLSIKGRTSMVGMKGDCAGAAGVLGAFAAAVRARPNITLHAVLCLAENSVGPNATRPDDIHTLYSGRTVEINNTDAEGRLVLADGVVFACRDLSAECIVDMATLTGAQGVATGKYHAAVLANHGGIEGKTIRAGRLSGDLTHAVPFAPELHFPEFSSTVADMKNSVADRSNAQPSCAGLFILAHLGFDYPGDWLHIDMASPAHVGERATGYGVALLNVLFGSHFQDKLLKALSPGPLLK